MDRAQVLIDACRRVEWLPLGALPPLLVLAPQNHEPWWWSSIAMVFGLTGVLSYRNWRKTRSTHPAWLGGLRDHSSADLIGTVDTPRGQVGPNGYFWLGPGYCSNWLQARIDASMSSADLRALADFMDARQAELVANRLSDEPYPN